MESQIIVDNLLISYLKSGDVSGEANLLFLHGWRSQKEVWQSIIHKLLSTKHLALGTSLYAIDLPGFGKSATPTKDFTVGVYVEVVKGFIENLELKNVILVGHSFGGRVGIKLASKYPGTISKLILVDSAGFVTHQQKKNLMAGMAKIVKPFFKPKFMQGMRQKIYKHIGAEDYLATTGLQKTFVNVVNEDLTEDMERILCPTLIVYGENDTETPPEFGQRMQLKIKNSKLKILSNAGHFSFLDQPGSFIESFADFIKKT